MIVIAIQIHIYIYKCVKLLVQAVQNRSIRRLLAVFSYSYCNSMPLTAVLSRVICKWEASDRRTGRHTHIHTPSLIGDEKSNLPTSLIIMTPTFWGQNHASEFVVVFVLNSDWTYLTTKKSYILGHLKSQDVENQRPAGQTTNLVRFSAEILASLAADQYLRRVCSAFPMKLCVHPNDSDMQQKWIHTLIVVKRSSVDGIMRAARMAALLLLWSPHTCLTRRKRGSRFGRGWRDGGGVRRDGATLFVGPRHRVCLTTCYIRKLGIVEKRTGKEGCQEAWSKSLADAPQIDQRFPDR